MFRFKLRTLLIATALVAGFLGFQVHVHMKAKRFVDRLNSLSAEDSPIARSVRADISPLSLTDVFRIQRHCEVNETRTVTLMNLRTQATHSHFINENYRIRCFGKTSLLDSISRLTKDVGPVVHDSVGEPIN